MASMLYGHLPQVIGVIGAGQMGSGIAQVRAGSKKQCLGPAQVTSMIARAGVCEHDASIIAAACAR